MSRKTRKLMWSVPLIAAVAVIGMLAMFAATTPGGVFAHDLPGAPGDVTATADGPNAIKVSWSAPTTGGTPTGYRIDRSEDGNTWFTHVENTESTAVTYTDSDLEPVQTYYYRVFGINSAGTGPVAKDDFASTAAAKAPGVPQQLRAAVMGQNDVTVTWLAPTDDGGSPLDKYRIQIWSPGGTPTDTGVPATMPAVDATDTAATDLTDGVVEVDHNDTATQQTYSHEKALAGTRYLYRVLAINEVPLTSTYSDPEDAETTDLDQPQPPTQLRAVQSGETEVQLYWSAPTNTGGADISDYKVEVATKATGASFVDGSDLTYTAAAATMPDATHSGIASGTEQVRYRVYSETGVDPDATPPTGLRSENFAEVTITLKDATTRTAQVHTLPVQPEGATGSVPIATRDNFGNVKVTWGPPASLADTAGPSTVSGYMIDVSDDGISWSRLQYSTGRTSNQYLYVDEEKEPRHYRIFAWNGGVLGPASGTGEAQLITANVAAPGPVRNLRAVANGPTQIDLSWDEPSDLGNAPIKRYNIHAIMTGTDGTYPAWPAVDAGTDTGTSDAAAGTTVIFHTEDGDTTTFSHTKLKAGQTWRYRVLAVNETAADPPVEQVVATGFVYKTSTTDQESMPEAPEGLTAEDAKDSSNQAAQDRGVLLQWNAPNPPDGATLAGYQVDRKVGDGDWETLAADTGSLFTDYTDEDEPAADELRAYRVRALSDGGVEGVWSDTVYYPHALAMHGPAVLTAPSDVTATDATADPGEYIIEVTWVNGENAESHIAMLFDSNWDPGDRIATFQDSMDTTFTVTEAGTYYAVVVAVESREHYLYGYDTITVGQ